MNNSATSLISIEYHIQGPSFTVSSACSSANHAMGTAYETIKSGKSKILITGGSESFLSFGGIELIDVNVSSPGTNSIQF